MIKHRMDDQRHPGKHFCLTSTLSHTGRFLIEFLAGVWAAMHRIRFIKSRPTASERHILELVIRIYGHRRHRWTNCFRMNRGGLVLPVIGTNGRCIFLVDLTFLSRMQSEQNLSDSALIDIYLPAPGILQPVDTPER
jgi:hypothetical protein